MKAACLPLILAAQFLAGCGALHITVRDYVPPQQGPIANVRILSNMHLIAYGHDCGADDRSINLARLYSGPIAALNLNNDKNLNMPLEIEDSFQFRTELAVQASQKYGISLVGIAPPVLTSVTKIQGGGVILQFDRSQCNWNFHFFPRDGALYEIALFTNTVQEARNSSCRGVLFEIVRANDGTYARQQIEPDGMVMERGRTREETCRKAKVNH